MTTNSVVTFEKPLQHLSLADWNSRFNQLRNVAETRRTDTFNLRHSARNLRNETKIQTEWDTYYNNARLSDRVAEIDRWRQIMQSCLDRVNNEMKMLREEKNSTERELEQIVTPLSVVSECLTMRDCRLGSELTYDDADTELKKELCVVENNQKMLRDKCQAAWEKLNRLEDIKFKLELDVDAKKEAQEIDISQLNIDRFCANITFKPDSLRIPRNSCTYKGWFEYTSNLKKLADTELEDAYAMREALFVTREKARNILGAQQERTEHTIRKRVFETQRARNELEWQQMKIKEEMENCACEIKTLVAALNDKTDALKLAETRLENRAQRAGMELCLDEAHDGLCEEDRRLRATIKSLSEKINCAKSIYSALEQHSIKIDKDLDNKQHSLMTDIRGLDLRMRLRGGEYNSCKENSTDRNIKLSGMNLEIPKC